MSSTTSSYMTFLLGGQTYGVELSSIREIITYRPMVAIPDAPSWLVGILEVRGKAMPVVDLRIRFRLGDRFNYTPNTVIIAFKQPGDSLLGAIVDEIKDIQNASEGQLLSESDTHSVVDVTYINGYLRCEESVIVLLDIQKLLDKQELERFLDGQP